MQKIADFRRLFLPLTLAGVVLMTGFFVALIPGQARAADPVFYAEEDLNKPTAFREPISSVICGETYVFDVEGYEGSEVWLEQFKSGRQVFKGVFSVPMDPYTSVCEQDEGKYTTFAYEIRTNFDGTEAAGLFIGQVDFEVKSADIADTTTIRSVAPGVFALRPAPDHDSVRSGYFNSYSASEELLKQYEEEMNILVYIPSDSLIDFVSPQQRFCTCAWGAQLPAEGIGYPWRGERSGELYSYAQVPTANWWGTGFYDGYYDEYTMYALLHELGHAWSTFFGNVQGSLNELGLLEKGYHAHWGYISDNQNSIMKYGPAQLDELKPGAFTPVWETSINDLVFNDFDLYAMGVLPADQVKPTFIVANPFLGTGPQFDTFRGFKREVTIEDVIALHGPRTPASGISKINQTNNVKVTFLIVQAPDGTDGELDVIGSKVKQIAELLPQTWNEKTRGLSSLSVFSPSKKIAVVDEVVKQSTKTVGELREEAQKIGVEAHNDTAALLRDIKQKQADFETAVRGIVASTEATDIPSEEGALVADSGGTVYLIENGQRRPFRSPDVFFSHGYDFSHVVRASTADLALPIGPVVTFRDGTLVKGPNNPLVHLISNGQKRPFQSADDFLGLGYSFENVVTANPETFADVPDGPLVDEARTGRSHPPGTLINDNGTIYLVTPSGRKAFSSIDQLYSYGYDVSEIVPANGADRALANEGEFARRTVAVRSSYRAPAVPNLSGPLSVFTGSNQGFSISSSDPDNDSITYVVSWGDGAQSSQTLPSGSAYTFSHAWTVPGIYPIKIEANDGFGNKAQNTYYISVNPEVATPTDSTPEPAKESASEPSDNSQQVFGTPGFYFNSPAGLSKVNSLNCGQTYTFKVDGYSGSQVWLEQTKNGSQNYNGIYNVPDTYTSVCNKDEGTYINTVYTVSNGARGSLIGSTTFTVNEKTTSESPINPSPFAFVRMVSPNGGESYVAGSDITIEWTQSNTLNGGASIERVSYGYKSCDTCQTNWIRENYTLPAPNASATRIGWTIPAGLAPGNNYKFRIIGYSDTGAVVSDESDAPFTVVKAEDTTATIDIKANGSDGPINITAGASVNLTWSSTGSFASCVARWLVLPVNTPSSNIQYPISNEVYTMDCVTSSGAVVSDSVTVNVTAPSGTPAFYLNTPFGLSKVSSVNCGATYTFKVDGYSGSQVWLVQEKLPLGSSTWTTSYNGIYTIPDTYTSVCNQDEGIYSNTVYTVVNGQKGSLLGSTGNFEVKTQSTSSSPITDSTPPSISNISASNLSTSGATISWTTDEASDTQVEYGTTTSFGSQTSLNTSLVTSHSQTLSGLSAGTTYYYRVKSRDSSGNIRLSTTQTFTTEAASEPEPSGTPGFYKSTPFGYAKISSVTCGQDSYRLQVDGYSESQIWLYQLKDGSVQYNGLYSVPSTPYTASCTNDVGNYTAYVYTVENNSRGSLLGSATLTVQAVQGAVAVQNTAPTAPNVSGNNSISAGVSASFNGYSTDSDADVITYTVSWGDGSAQETYRLGSGYVFFANHAWQNAGNYNITFTAKDGKGGARTTSYGITVQ